MPRDGSQFDPDDAPEQSREFVGKLVRSVYIEDGDHAEELGEPMASAYKRYTDKAGRDPKTTPCWYLQAEGLSVVRSDGQPFVQSDIMPLVTKDGRRLWKGQAPDMFSQAYLALDVSASYARVGEPNSAVGRAFHFSNHDVNLGGFTKSFRLWPLELYPEGYEYDGEVRTVTVNQDGDSDAPAEPTASGLSEAEAISTLQTLLQDKPVDSTFDLIMGEQALKATGKVLGVALLEAATDGSLTEVLKENAILTVDEQGIYRIPVAAAAAAA